MESKTRESVGPRTAFVLILLIFLAQVVFVAERGVAQPPSPAPAAQLPGPSPAAKAPAIPAKGPDAKTGSETAKGVPGKASGAQDAAAEPTRNKVPTTPLEIAEALTMPFLASFVLCSVIAVWFSIERLLVLRRGRVIPRPFVQRFIQNLEQGNLDPDQALSLCQENGSPVANVFAHGIRKWGKPSVEVEQAIIDGGERQVSQLRSHLRVLNSLATIGPLLGLLGTVIGMIQCFNEIAMSEGMGKADMLAGGIATALLTTAVGFVIAIPCLTMYMYLTGRVDSLVMDMDELAQNVVQLISAETLAESGAAGARTKPRRPAPPQGEPKERRPVQA